VLFRSLAMHQPRHFVSNDLLRLWTPSCSAIRFLYTCNDTQIEKGEITQKPVDVGVCGVDPELIEGIRRRFRRIQPHSARLRFAELGAVSFGYKRYSQPVDRLMIAAAGQIDTPGDIAPLVRATDLNRAVDTAIEFGEVIRLKKLVAELGEGVTHSLALDTLIDRLLMDHRVDREMLAILAQEIQRRH